MPQDDNKPDLPTDQNQTYLEDPDQKEEDPVIPDTSSPEQDKSLRAASLKAYGSFSTIGIFFLLAVIICYYIGHNLDELFHLDKPIFTVFWVICGIAATIKEFVTMVKKAQKLGENDDASPKA